jgi:hypothetical protein
MKITRKVEIYDLCGPLGQVLNALRAEADRLPCPFEDVQITITADMEYGDSVLNAYLSYGATATEKEEAEAKRERLVYTEQRRKTYEMLKKEFEPKED